MLAPSPSQEPPPRRPRTGHTIWGSLWPVILVLLSIVVTAVFMVVIGIALRSG
jgi:hypothetical protein